MEEACLSKLDMFLKLYRLCLFFGWKKSHI